MDQIVKVNISKLGQNDEICDWRREGRIKFLI